MEEDWKDFITPSPSPLWRARVTGQHCRTGCGQRISAVRLGVRLEARGPRAPVPPRARTRTPSPPWAATSDGSLFGHRVVAGRCLKVQRRLTRGWSLDKTVVYRTEVLSAEHYLLLRKDDICRVKKSVGPGGPLSAPTSLAGRGPEGPMCSLGVARCLST